jgi:hypothetical protein
MVRVQLCGCLLMLAVVPSGPLCIERVYEFPRATYKSRIRLRHPGCLFVKVSLNWLVKP